MRTYIVYMQFLCVHGMAVTTVGNYLCEDGASPEGRPVFPIRIQFRSSRWVSSDKV